MNSNDKAGEVKAGQGWICPRCQKVHSWLSMTCDCVPNCTYTTAGTTLPSSPSLTNALEEVERLRKVLLELKTNPQLWKIPRAGGQDQYAGMPPAIRLINSALSHPNKE